jgi:hypothetical protein
LKAQTISDCSAENVYKLVYDKENVKVDQEGTRKARQAERQARLGRSVAYGDFEKEMEGPQAGGFTAQVLRELARRQNGTPIKRP